MTEAEREADSIVCDFNDARVKYSHNEIVDMIAKALKRAEQRGREDRYDEVILSDIHKEERKVGFLRGVKFVKEQGCLNSDEYEARRGSCWKDNHDYQCPQAIAEAMRKEANK